jgi:hypothetical protein
LKNKEVWSDAFDNDSHNKLVEQTAEEESQECRVVLAEFVRVDGFTLLEPSTGKHGEARTRELACSSCAQTRHM